MSLHALHRQSLRRTLITVLLGGVLLGTAVQAWMTWHTAEAAVNAAFDRSLYGAIRAIDANVSTASGGLGVELPYALFEFFELTASGRVYYRVATEDGLVEIGSPDLPMPTSPLVDRQPHFQTHSYVDGPVRVGTYVRAIDAPIGGHTDRRLVIQVAEALTSRNHFSQQLLLGAVMRDLLLAGFAAGLTALAVSWSLRPLGHLQQELRQRAVDDLSPVDTTQVPADVLPLVEAMNDHVVRYRVLLSQQRRFLDDASHQLRTPLTTLLTQVGFALRTHNLQATQETLSAMRQQLKHTIRQVNQMLALGRADTATLAVEPTDVAALAESVTRHCWPRARERTVDLGFHPSSAPLMAPVHRELLEEALSNLLDNALRHTPAGGRITVSVRADDTHVQVQVTDSGTGIPDAELPRVVERYFRASNSQGAGSGLGLAIVQSIARRHHGELSLQRNGPSGGLRASFSIALHPRPDHSP